MTLDVFRAIFALSYTDPRKAAQYWIGQQLSFLTAVQMLLLMAIILTLVGAIEQMVTDIDPASLVAGGNRFSVMLIHSVLIAVPGALIHVIGDRTGSTARFADSLMMVVWLQVVVLPIQFAATLSLALGGAFTSTILFTYVAVTFWILTHFITELHGYKSRLNVFLGIMTVSIVLGLLLIPFLDPSFAGA